MLRLVALRLLSFIPTLLAASLVAKHHAQWHTSGTRGGSP